MEGLVSYSDNLRALIAELGGRRLGDIPRHGADGPACLELRIMKERASHGASLGPRRTEDGDDSLAGGHCEYQAVLD